MVSSVSVDDSLRKKIKKIAADLDTSQGEIIERGIEMLEESLKKRSEKRDHPAKKIMKRAAKEREDNEWRQKIRAKLTAPGIPIDQVTITQWGDFVED